MNGAQDGRSEERMGLRARLVASSRTEGAGSEFTRRSWAENAVGTGPHQELLSGQASGPSLGQLVARTARRPPECRSVGWSVGYGVDALRAARLHSNRPARTSWRRRGGRRVWWVPRLHAEPLPHARRSNGSETLVRTDPW